MKVLIIWDLQFMQKVEMAFRAMHTFLEFVHRLSFCHRTRYFENKFHFLQERALVLLEPYVELTLFPGPG
jgi:hypothetical protein